MNRKSIVKVFKCCSVDGAYYGDRLIHNPEVPGDGPWYLSIKTGDSFTEFGFGTKAAALSTLAALCYPDEHLITVEPWD